MVLKDFIKILLTNLVNNFMDKEKIKELLGQALELLKKGKGIEVGNYLSVGFVLSQHRSFTDNIIRSPELRFEVASFPKGEKSFGNNMEVGDGDTLEEAIKELEIKFQKKAVKK